MMKWLRDIIDSIKWARMMMRAEREDAAFTAKISYFISGTIMPASLKYKKEYGHSPKYLLLPMDRLADVHRMICNRQYHVSDSDNKICNIELAWNGEEGEEGWSFSDKNPEDDE